MFKGVLIPILTTLPAVDATPSGAVRIANANTLELSGRVTGGSGVLHLLRRIQLSDTSFQFRPWCEDRPIDPFERTDVNGFFSARVRLPLDGGPEEFALYNPGGALTLDGAAPVVAQGAVY